jgi:hypothetical protein
MARRAAGLDSDESAPKVNVSLNLVNQRILAMQQAGQGSGMSSVHSPRLATAILRSKGVRRALS